MNGYCNIKSLKVTLSLRRSRRRRIRQVANVTSVREKTVRRDRIELRTQLHLTKFSSPVKGLKDKRQKQKQWLKSMSLRHMGNTNVSHSSSTSSSSSISITSISSHRNVTRERGRRRKKERNTCVHKCNTTTLVPHNTHTHTSSMCVLRRDTYKKVTDKGKERRVKVEIN